MSGEKEADDQGENGRFIATPWRRVLFWGGRRELAPGGDGSGMLGVQPCAVFSVILGAVRATGDATNQASVVKKLRETSCEAPRLEDPESVQRGEESFFKKRSGDDVVVMPDDRFQVTSSKDERTRWCC